jgi:hypothetical protein
MKTKLTLKLMLANFGLLAVACMGRAAFSPDQAEPAVAFAHLIDQYDLKGLPQAGEVNELIKSRK